MKVLILDNGHGKDTPGKCSPDKRILEYAWARDMVSRIAAKAMLAGIRTEVLVPEEIDIPLKERVRRANAICAKYGTQNCILISVHLNAAGNGGRWLNACGWSGWVAPVSSQKSKDLARLLFNEADKLGLRGNRAVPPCRYWVGNFAIIRDTKCPAVLTENLFQDNKSDVDYLVGESGKEAIANLHINAVKEYFKEH